MKQIFQNKRKSCCSINDNKMKISHEIYIKYINIYITQFYITTINHYIHAKLRMKFRFKNMKTVKIFIIEIYSRNSKNHTIKVTFLFRYLYWLSRYKGSKFPQSLTQIMNGTATYIFFWKCILCFFRNRICHLSAIQDRSERQGASEIRINDKNRDSKQLKIILSFIRRYLGDQKSYSKR